MTEYEESGEMPELSEQGVDADPIKQFARWFTDAEAAGLKLPNAMTLATATADGVPSARVVVVTFPVMRTWRSSSAQ